MVDDVFELVGTTVDSRYRVDAVAAEGGFGIVYRGWHVAFGHPIAVKCLKVPAHFTPDAKRVFLEKFREEGAFLSRLSEHPSIVRVFDLNVARTPSGTEVPYLVLEWLEGLELSRLVASQRSGQRGAMKEEDVVALLKPAIDAIAFAHTLKIAHRDLKPENLLQATTQRGEVLKVLDFGIAKAMQEGETATQLATRTTSGFAAFSPQYGSPEQFRPKKYGATGPWTDVYALALIMSELASGRAAHEGEEQADFYEACMSPTRPTPRSLGAIVSDRFEMVCGRALAVEPKARFRDANELMLALEGGDPPLSSEESPLAGSAADALEPGVAGSTGTVFATPSPAALGQDANAPKPVGLAPFTASAPPAIPDTVHRKCPYCAEIIADEDRVCPHCDSNLTSGQGPLSNQEPAHRSSTSSQRFEIVRTNHLVGQSYVVRRPGIKETLWRVDGSGLTGLRAFQGAHGPQVATMTVPTKYWIGTAVFMVCDPAGREVCRIEWPRFSSDNSFAIRWSGRVYAGASSHLSRQYVCMGSTGETMVTMTSDPSPPMFGNRWVCVQVELTGEIPDLIAVLCGISLDQRNS